jgi:hypothetical protein
MVDIFNLKDDIVKVLFYLNLILLIVGIFVSSKTYFISVIIVNIIFNGSFLIILKWSNVFTSRGGMFGELFGKMGNLMDNLNPQENNNGKVQG